jgi:integrase
MLFGYTKANAPHGRQPQIAGQPRGQKRPLKPKDVWAIRVRLQLEGSTRDLALFNMAIDSKLRGCDLVKLRVEDVQTESRVKERSTVIQQKTGKPVQFELTEVTRVAVRDWLLARPAHDCPFLFPSRVGSRTNISTRQYARLVHVWIKKAGLDPTSYGTHSMRRTKAAQIYKKTGNLRAVQLLLGHTKIETTVRYLGVDVDDALNLSEQVEL